MARKSSDKHKLNTRFWLHKSRSRLTCWETLVNYLIEKFEILAKNVLVWNTVADDEHEDAVHEKLSESDFDVKLLVLVVFQHFSRCPHALNMDWRIILLHSTFSNWIQINKLSTQISYIKSFPYTEHRKGQIRVGI